MYKTWSVKIQIKRPRAHIRNAELFPHFLFFWPSHQLFPRATEYIFHFCSFTAEPYHSTEQTGKLLHTCINQSRNQAWFFPILDRILQRNFLIPHFRKIPCISQDVAVTVILTPKRNTFFYSIMTFFHSTCFPIPCTYFLQCYLLCLLGDSFVMALVKQIRGGGGNESLQFTGFKNDQFITLIIHFMYGASSRNNYLSHRNEISA